MSEELREVVARALTNVGLDEVYPAEVDTAWTGWLVEADAAIVAATPLIEAALIKRMRKRWFHLSVSPEALATWGLDDLTYTQREQVSQWMQTWSDARFDGEGE